jgi:hypothetical protein
MAGRLQTFKEQARERLTYSTLPRFDGNASLIIQLFSGLAGFSAFLMAFARAEGARRRLALADKQRAQRWKWKYARQHIVKQ